MIQQDQKSTIVSNQEFDVIAESQESNKKLKKTPRDEGMPMFQKQHNTRQAVQNDGVQSFLMHDESSASLILPGNRDRYGNIKEEKKYNVLESNSSASEQATTRRQRLSDRFSPVQKSPRGIQQDGTAVIMQKMYSNNSNQSPKTKQQSGTMIKQLTNAPIKSPYMKPQIQHKQAPPVNQKTLRQSKLNNEGGSFQNADRIVQENLKQDNLQNESQYKSYNKKEKDQQLQKLNPVITPASSYLENESFTDMKNSERATIVQADIKEMQRQGNDELNTQEAENDVPVQVEDLYVFKESKRLTIQANQQDYTNITDSDLQNPFTLVRYSPTEMNADSEAKEPVRKSDLHRVYTYTYNESPMSKELERGQIKNTVVRSTRLNENGTQQLNDFASHPTSIIARNSNPMTPLQQSQRNSSPTRLSLTQKPRLQLGNKDEQRQIGSFPLSANIKNFIRQSSPQFAHAKKIMPALPIRKLRSGEGTYEIPNTETSQERSDTENNQQKGMFNNFMKTIGTMFATSPHQQNEVQMQELHKQQSGSFERPENLQPSAAEISVNLEDDANDDSDITPPPMRSGRVCDCPKDHDFPMLCSKARQWYERTSSRSFSLNNNTYNKLKETYKSLVNIKADEESMAQIERDLGRTFPRHPYFMQELGGKGHQKLRRVLIAFSNYDCQVDYVQGMNFIVAQLLLHCSETFAFWLFVALIEDCEMRDIYLPKLPGLFKHSQMIELLIKVNLPKLQCHLIEHNIRAQMYASEWIFGLFASVIPCEHMSLFLDKFFQHKWIFFYSLILTILRKHEDQILNEEDFYCILHQIKAQQHKASGISALKTTKTIITQAEKERLQNEEQSLGDFNTDDSGLNETSDEAEPKSMFNVFKKFISSNLGFAEDVGVTSSNFWPMMIERSQSEFPSLYKQQTGINRLLHEFDPEHMQFFETIPDDPWQINEILNR